VSTVQDGNLYMCPMDPTTRPAQPWSTDTLTTDCPGHYTLCMTFKAGDVLHPQMSDCTMAQTCTAGDYATAGQAQSWPAVPSWIASAAELPCVNQFYDTGGYAEMSVSGTATGCGQVSRVFARIGYCPLTCTNNPNAPGCDDCKQPGNGSF
jgi:hypothetical protein